MEKEQKVKCSLEDLAEKVSTMKSLICTYYVDGKPTSIVIDLNPEDSIGVEFEKGYVIVRTQFETKFVCKGNLFISMWR